MTITEISKDNGVRLHPEKANFPLYNSSMQQDQKGLSLKIDRAVSLYDKQMQQL